VVVRAARLLVLMFISQLRVVRSELGANRYKTGWKQKALFSARQRQRVGCCGGSYPYTLFGTALSRAVNAAG